MEDKIRRFEKTDWYGWAGAEKFHNGHNPFIFDRVIDDSAEITVVGDAHGVGITITSSFEDEITMLSWWFEIDMPELLVLGHMQAMIEEFELDKVADVATLCYKLDTTKTWNFEFAEG